MAKINKKLATVIACWGVALVMVITGICLGLVIPSSAANENEGDIAVMFDTNGDGTISEDETTIYHTMTAAFNAVNALTTTAGNQATIKLCSDVRIPDESGIRTNLRKAYCKLDLNGYVCNIAYAQISSYGGSLIITDSRPEVAHGFVYVGDGKYEYTNGENLIGYSSTVYGGVMVARGNLFTLVVHGGEQQEDSSTWVNYGDAELVLDKGTFVGGMSCVFLDQAKVVMNDGVNMQFHVDESDMGVSGMFTGGCSIFVMDKVSTVEIYGGNLYGQIIRPEEIDDAGNAVSVEVVDLTDKANLPDWVTMGDDIKIVEKEIDGVKVYTSVDATTEEPEPITKPTEPITDTEQPTNNNNNMIGLIVLGAAAAVMVIGVTTIIIVNVKRRKKVA